MNREIIQEVEQKLYKNFRQLRAMERKRKVLEKIERRIELAEKNIQNCNLNAESSIAGISYDREKVTGGEVSSSVEKALIRAQEKLENQLADLICEKYDVLAEIEEYHASTVEMEVLLSNLSDQDNKLLMLKYCKRMTLEKVGNEMGWSHSQVSRNRDRVITWIYHELSQ